MLLILLTLNQAGNDEQCWDIIVSYALGVNLWNTVSLLHSRRTLEWILVDSHGLNSFSWSRLYMYYHRWYDYSKYTFGLVRILSSYDLGVRSAHAYSMYDGWNTFCWVNVAVDTFAVYQWSWLMDSGLLETWRILFLWNESCLAYLVRIACTTWLNCWASTYVRCEFY